MRAAETGLCRCHYAGPDRTKTPYGMCPAPSHRNREGESRRAVQNSTGQCSSVIWYWLFENVPQPSLASIFDFCSSEISGLNAELPTYPVAGGSPYSRIKCFTNSFCMALQSQAINLEACSPPVAHLLDN